MTGVWNLLRNIAAALECLSLKTWTLKAFALNAEHTAAQVRARLLDLLILAMMGFVVMGCGRYALVGYAEDDEDFVICCNRPEQRKCTSINRNVLRVCFAVML